jgi:hypothetical protein
MARRTGRSQLTVLWRAFLAQFFTSESVTSDMHLRQAIIGVLAFLLPPGLFLLVEAIPLYALVATYFPEMLNELIVRLAFVFVTYSMVTVGFVTVFVWDTLIFECRDAMVLGPLPIASHTIVLAKLGALATFLLGSAAAVNLFTAVPFALITADRLGGRAFLLHFLAHLVATMGAATFVFASIVLLRGAGGRAGGARPPPRLGSGLQFLAVGALLCFVLLIPPALKTGHGFVGALATTGLLPVAWFVAVFEWLRGSDRPEAWLLTHRAAAALVWAVSGAIAVSVGGIRHQLRAALTPKALSGPHGSARIGRTVAGVLVAPDRVARAIADFILVTIARNRAQQVPIAICAALGAAIAMAGASRAAHDLSLLMHPRTVVLWIPLVIGYWLAIGVRASFFVPCELPAAWAFHTAAPEGRRATWAAVRASMLAVVVPPMFVVAMLLAPLVGWRLAALHALIASATLSLFVQLLALTVRHTPFIRPYHPGHAKLKTRWPLYLVGMYLVAYWPVRLELHLVDDSASLLIMGVCITVAVAVVDVVGRHTAHRHPDESYEDSDVDFSNATVLDISGAMHRADTGR